MNLHHQLEMATTKKKTKMALMITIQMKTMTILELLSKAHLSI